MIYFSTVPKTAKYGTETILLAPKVWVLVSRKIKECSCLEAFKYKSGNENRIVYVGYTKRICNMLIFVNYVHIYT